MFNPVIGREFLLEVEDDEILTEEISPLLGKDNQRILLEKYFQITSEETPDEISKISLNQASYSFYFSTNQLNSISINSFTVPKNCLPPGKQYKLSS